MAARDVTVERRVRQARPGDKAVGRVVAVAVVAAVVLKRRLLQSSR
jgi:hypothetical protein